MKEHILFAQDQDEGKRVDSFLAEYIPDFSRSRITSLILEGKVLVNDKQIKPSKKLLADDKILLTAPDIKEPDILPWDTPLDILYEDESVLVVNKPKGMAVHPSNGHFNDTLVNALMFSHKDSLSGINGVLRPGIVHRIDMDTTGSLIVCKNDEAHQCIASQIASHSLEREYEGIVHGIIKEDGLVDAPIGRSEKDRKKMAVNSKNGKNAITHYHVIKVYKDFTHMSFRLETGRTHQIRVHMAHIGHPILGDALYGPKKSPYKLQGQTLHAKTLGFMHPVSGRHIRVEAPLPEYFKKLLADMDIKLL